MVIFLLRLLFDSIFSEYFSKLRSKCFFFYREESLDGKPLSIICTLLSPAVSLFLQTLTFVLYII